MWLISSYFAQTKTSKVLNINPIKHCTTTEMPFSSSHYFWFANYHKKRSLPVLFCMSFFTCPSFVWFSVFLVVPPFNCIVLQCFYHQSACGLLSSLIVEGLIPSLVKGGFFCILSLVAEFLGFLICKLILHKMNYLHKSAWLLWPSPAATYLDFEKRLWWM